MWGKFGNDKNYVKYISGTPRKERLEPDSRGLG